MTDRTMTFDGTPLLYWYPKWLRPIVLALFPLLTAASLGLTVWCVLLIFEEPQSVVLSILTVSVTAGGTAFLFWYGWASWIDLCRMVRFSPDGLTEIDPNGKTRQIPWHAFSEICICYSAQYPERRCGNTTSVIAFILPGVKKDADQRWPTYSTRHFRKIICTLYSEDAIQKLRQLCPREIPDLRT